MATVVLHGALADTYGSSFDLNVSSVAEAIRLLDANFSGFVKNLLRNKVGYVVTVDGGCAATEGALRESHINPEIHIVPAIEGAGGDNDNGLFQIVLAVVLVAASYYGGFSADTSAMLFKTGVSLGISGVCSMLFSSSTATVSTNESIGETALTSYAFSGPVNTTSQGNPVPVLYGRLMVGSQVISAQIKVTG